MNITVVILTKDEACHIERSLQSVASFADRCVVVDSGSTDQTIARAKQAGAEVFVNPWVNHAVQFNWALEQLSKDTEWVMRLDADEIVTDALAAEILDKLTALGPEVHGVNISRRLRFLGRSIKWGGGFPSRVLRIFRLGTGRCENRWMDEHIFVEGKTAEFSGEIIDDNLKPLAWWTEKHNSYSSREVVDMLNHEYRFMDYETVADLKAGHSAGMKRWLKENAYVRLPGGIRALLYFFYRYFFRLGILDGKEGAAFHVLQGFWYRYLVDMKLHEVKAYMRREDVDVVTAIHLILGVKIEVSSQQPKNDINSEIPHDL